MKNCLGNKTHYSKTIEQFCELPKIDQTSQIWKYYLLVFLAKFSLEFRTLLFTRHYSHDLVTSAQNHQQYFCHNILVQFAT